MCVCVWYPILTPRCFLDICVTPPTDRYLPQHCLAKTILTFPPRRPMLTSLLQGARHSSRNITAIWTQEQAHLLALPDPSHPLAHLPRLARTFPKLVSCRAA